MKQVNCSRCMSITRCPCVDRAAIDGRKIYVSYHEDNENSTIDIIEKDFDLIDCTMVGTIKGFIHKDFENMLKYVKRNIMTREGVIVKNENISSLSFHLNYERTAEIKEPVLATLKNKAVIVIEKTIPSLKEIIRGVKDE